MTTLVVSTDHLAPSSIPKLAELKIPVATTATRWIVPVQDTQLPDLAQAFKLAKEQHCDAVIFDKNGIKHPDLAVWIW